LAIPVGGVSEDDVDLEPLGKRIDKLAELALSLAMNRKASAPAGLT